MIAKLQHPLFGAMAGVLLSLGLGLALCWRAAAPVMATMLTKRAPAPAEGKEKGWDFWTIEIENLSNELKGERARLQKQSEGLSQRAARLADEEKELAKVRAEMEALRREIGQRVIEINADEAKNLRSLAQTYTSLTPRAVVAIFKEMDDVTVVKILALMKPDVIGPIFEEMSHTSGTDGTLARRAAVLSEKLRLMKSTKPAAT